jgi:hypothetical protein
MKNLFILLIILSTGNAFTQTTLKKEGDWCSENLTLKLVNETDNLFSIQWRKDGLDLAGENKTSINCSEYGLGNYSVSFVIAADTQELSYLLSHVNGPIASINSEKFPAAGMVIFQSQSVEGAANNVSWSWDFGNGSTSTAAKQSVFYDAEGEYEVKLTVVDENGCSNSTSINYNWSYN